MRGVNFAPPQPLAQVVDVMCFDLCEGQACVQPLLPAIGCKRPLQLFGSKNDGWVTNSPHCRCVHVLQSFINRICRRETLKTTHAIGELSLVILASGALIAGPQLDGNARRLHKPLFSRRCPAKPKFAFSQLVATYNLQNVSIYCNAILE